MHTFYQTWVTVQVRQEYLDVQRLTKTRLTRGLTLDGLIEGRVELRLTRQKCIKNVGLRRLRA
uniref:Uncharacterized protein n=2 Tax=Candidatus Kentrum sp. SD TaxID=2126332 RepID=A0A450Y6G6_9GAMM|nr:MAG: hypothetical protein BECKSD772F_GA0070984_101053 [Candidatus Kentron sp. SD]